MLLGFLIIVGSSVCVGKTKASMINTNEKIIPVTTVSTTFSLKLLMLLNLLY